MNHKLSVATRTGVADQKHKRIFACMTKYPEGITPKAIALYTSINVNTIKAILPKLKGVKKIMRGYYKVVGGGTAPPHPIVPNLSDWNFHNCILSTQLRANYTPYQPTTHSFGLINVTFIISQSGKATLRISADNPLNVSSLCMAYAYFSEWLSQRYTGSITPKEVYISSIEFNKDYINLKLDGVCCITLDNLIEQFKVYQKKLGMRIEHKTKVSLTVENVLDMLTNNPNSLEVNMKLTHQKKLLEKLTTETIANTRLIEKLLNQNAQS